MIVTVKKWVDEGRRAACRTRQLLHQFLIVYFFKKIFNLYLIGQAAQNWYIDVRPYPNVVIWFE